MCQMKVLTKTRLDMCEDLFSVSGKILPRLGQSLGRSSEQRFCLPYVTYHFSYSVFSEKKCIFGKEVYFRKSTTSFASTFIASS